MLDNDEFNLNELSDKHDEVQDSTYFNRIVLWTK